MRFHVAALVMLGFAGSALAADAPQPAVVIPGLTPPAQSMAPASQAPTPKPIIATLSDNSQVEFDADDTVWVTAPNGVRTPAPDGTLTLKDSTPFTVKAGKRVNEE